jgi:putative oxidoreductase
MDWQDKASAQAGWALLLNRVGIALVFLWHGMPKALDFSMAFDKFVGFGFPGFLGPVVGWVEVIAALLLLLGFRARLSALVLGVIIVVALITVQIPGGITAGLERDMLVLIACLVAVTHGSGKLSLKG